MITLRRNGKTYQITEEDQERIREIVLTNGGDVQAAMRQQFREKFGEEMGSRERDDGK